MRHDASHTRKANDARPKQRALLCGYYGMGNAGDEALLVCLLQALPSHIEPVVLSKTPMETRDRYQVQTCDRWNLGAILREMRRSSWFIWGGGSLMQDSSSRVSPLYYGGLMKLAQILGLRTIAWAQGLGPLNHRSNRWLTRHVLKRCHLVTVRDTVSYDLVRGWNIPVTIAPDPVWAMQAESVVDLSHLPGPRIAVNLREHSTLTPDRLKLITEALRVLQDREQGTIVLIPFQKSLDYPLAQDLQSKLPGSVIHMIDSPQILKGLFQQVELTIAMRLHAVIMAVSEGCECFALCYDPKVSRVMETAGLGGIELAEMEDTELGRTGEETASDHATPTANPTAKHLMQSGWFTALRSVNPGKAHPIARETFIPAAKQHTDLLRKVLDSKP